MCNTLVAYRNCAIYIQLQKLYQNTLDICPTHSSLQAFVIVYIVYTFSVACYTFTIDICPTHSSLQAFVIVYIVHFLYEAIVCYTFTIAYNVLQGKFNIRASITLTAFF